MDCLVISCYNVNCYYSQQNVSIYSNYVFVYYAFELIFNSTDKTIDQEDSSVSTFVHNDVNPIYY